MIFRKKVFWIAAFIVVAAIAIVLCVGYFTEGQATEFDGTLVYQNIEFPNLF
jgi:hypothetical protein